MVAASASAPLWAQRPDCSDEIAYAEALVNSGYPDIAESLIASIKSQWPESEADLFALEIRGMISLGRFEEAERKIAALPDRGSKYWASRLEVANGYFSQGPNGKAECMRIYDAFFRLFTVPPDDMRTLYLEAGYAYGQILARDSKQVKAAQLYEHLMKEATGEMWCNLAAEAVKMYIKSAEGMHDPKLAKERSGLLSAAESIVDRLLWRLDWPMYFGQAISMKTHIVFMRGDTDGAREIVSEYIPWLQELHNQIVQSDPEGRNGLLRMSPLPECLYLQARMMWSEALAESGKTEPDEERMKALMFGERDKDTGRRIGRGAFNFAASVFFNYESSVWAPQAGELSEEIKTFAEKRYGAKVRVKISPEQRARVRAAQFKAADAKFIGGDYVGAIEGYSALLRRNPESVESISAVANIAMSLQYLFAGERDADKKESYRIDADAIEGYLAERFAHHKDKVVMNEAGDAVVRLAIREQELGQPERADRLYTEFIRNYSSHANAVALAVAKATELQSAGKWHDAIRYWRFIEDNYPDSQPYATALAQISHCYGCIGDKTNEISYICKYLPLETAVVRRLQAQFHLAQIQNSDNIGTINAIKQFTDLAAQAEAGLGNQRLTEAERNTLSDLREGALFLAGQCRARLGQSLKKMGRTELGDKQMLKSAEAYETYLAAYPQGKYAKSAYVQQGTIYTALGQMGKSKETLDRLSRAFPDSDEAKNAKPYLAKSLIDMGMRREGTEIYAEMLRTDGSYTAQQFAAAGEALIEAKSWDYANRAFEKAIRLAGTNFPATVARSRLGMAKSAYRQGSLAEARESLDQFLSDPKMSKMAIAADANFLLVKVASDQGRAEKDATMRGKYFGAAIGALKKVRTYWAKKEPWEQATLDLLSGDVLVDRMMAEEAMGLTEEAKETCGRAAVTFQVFIQVHGVSADHPADKMSAGELANLERAYASMLPLFVKQGSAQADNVLKYGQQYLELFPNGGSRTEVVNCMNAAKADAT